MREYFTGEIGEALCPSGIDGGALTQSEIEVLLGLVHTPLEWRALHRILQFISAR
jgi:hypothetical protein